MQLELEKKKQEGGLTQLQYADVTILFVQNSEQDIINLKFLLFCYE